MTDSPGRPRRSGQPRKPSQSDREASQSDKPDDPDQPDQPDQPDNPGRLATSQPPAKGSDGTANPQQLTAVQVLRAASEQLAELTGLRTEGISRLERTDAGWVAEAEVVEVARIPETMSVMGLYEVTLDPAGMLTGYRRVRRYERGRTDSR
ncbi:gas vesicle protein GvpO [Streptomyces sp. NPDC000405]|uniref:gas vesicle protein GvpO n=1 Tax=Streptomyces sp. NPDC000405 TaxID=3161033 RepID=UPI00398D2AF5